MKSTLGSLAFIHSGYPFRGKVSEDEGGSVRVVQMKHVDRDTGIAWDGLILTNLPGKGSPHWLEAGDVLFVARGITNYAVIADTSPKQTVVSPHFFQIKTKDKGVLLPEFLVWQINQAAAQKYFKKSSEGSAVVGIRKSLLSKLPILVPSIEEQRKVVEMVECWKKQRAAIESLSENHKKLMAAIANKVLNNKSEGEENNNEFTD